MRSAPWPCGVVVPTILRTQICIPLASAMLSRCANCFLAQRSALHVFTVSTFGKPAVPKLCDCIRVWSQLEMRPNVVMSSGRALHSCFSAVVRGRSCAYASKSAVLNMHKGGLTPNWKFFGIARRTLYRVRTGVVMHGSHLHTAGRVRALSSNLVKWSAASLTLARVIPPRKNPSAGVSFAFCIQKHAYIIPRPDESLGRQSRDSDI